ncbi:CesT family type III secretion system chaperone [Roseateles sp. SL47]|uniref:CesT family type III secretion system chaperone n=1 Tax=Roseateles sp. SL47 TaxID=2995138 RepID=UPI00226F47AB|nr:CesT family type III secretion system chaperone [Roseateles sp. SL47]WAC74554.1 CesT family type III secretion system chaperone [Roseateles sp. SL47]
MTDYERLIQDFCAMAGLPDAASVASGSPIEVDGITCSITASRQRPMDALVLYTEFGSVPAGREVAVFEELLSQNYIGAPDAGVSFGYSGVARHVVCMQQLRTADVNAQRLADMLHHIAEKAHEWRRTYFLKAAEPTRAVASHAVSGGTRALLNAARGSLGRPN